MKQYTHLRIPIAVEEDAGIGRLKIKAHSARPRTHQKDKLIGIGRVELIDNEVAAGPGGRPIESTVLPPTHAAVIVQNVKNARELAEKDGAVALLEETPKKLIERSQLAAGGNQILERSGLNVKLGTIKEEGVQTALAQLHNEIIQLGRGRWGGLLI